MRFAPVMKSIKCWKALARWNRQASVASTIFLAGITFMTPLANAEPQCEVLASLTRISGGLFAYELRDNGSLVKSRVFFSNQSSSDHEEKCVAMIRTLQNEESKKNCLVDWAKVRNTITSKTPQLGQCINLIQEAGVKIKMRNATNAEELPLKGAEEIQESGVTESAM